MGNVCLSISSGDRLELMRVQHAYMQISVEWYKAMRYYWLLNKRDLKAEHVMEISIWQSHLF